MSFSTRMTKKSKKWRCALIYLALFGVAPMAFGAETRYVSNFDELKAAISEFNANTGVDYQIILKNSVTLTEALPVVTGNADLVGADSGSLEIIGNNYTIDGANAYRGLFIDSQESGSNVGVTNLNFANCVAEGGAGGNGAGGGGGGMGAGAAIYALSGEVKLLDVTAYNNQAIGGAGGTILQESQSYGGGAGIGGAGGSGVVGETGAADGGGIISAGADSKESRLAGDGGVTSSTDPESFAHFVNKTTPVGGNSLAGGGGGGSTAIGGAGGFGGGGGAGGADGGVGGFGGGGGGGASATTAGLGGFGAGNGGYVDAVTSEQFSDTQGGGVGGGGAALGAAIFVGCDANVTIAVSGNVNSSIYGNSVRAGQGGGGTAEDGEAIGSGIFLLNDLSIEVAEGGNYTISDSIGGYAGSANVQPDANGDYADMSGIVKTGEGTLYLEGANSSYAGDTVLNGGKIVAKAEGAISSYSNLNVKKGEALLTADQSVKNLKGSVAGVVDLNGQTLTITGDNTATYAGQLKGDGLLLKDGTGLLALSGDNSESGRFNTEIRGGTIRVLNDNALGQGDVVYTRTDANDRTSALDFGTELTLDNDIYLSANSVPVILSGQSATLNGRLVANQSLANEIDVNLNDGATLTVNNTSVETDDSGNRVSNGRYNTIEEYRLNTGNLRVKVDSFETSGDNDVRYWYSAIGNSKVTNAGNNSLFFGLDTDDAGEGLQFANNLALESGWLSIDPVTLNQSTESVKDIYFVGNTSGNGGLRVNVGSGATIHASGGWNHAKTDIASGSLDVSGVSSDMATLGELSASGDGTLQTGTKDVQVKFDNGDVLFDGKIVGADEGSTIYKDGDGSWTMNLSSDSKVKAVEIVDGVFSLGDNHFESGLYPSNDFKVEVWSQGAFKLASENGATLKLNNFIASTPGGVVEIGEKDELVLTSNNSSTTIGTNLRGAGWLSLENVVDGANNVVPWVVSGDNSNWQGTIAARGNNSVVTLASKNAGSSSSKMSLGAHSVLNVNESTVLGNLDFDNNATIKVAPGRTFTLNGLSSNVLWLDDSTTTVTGGGVLMLNAGAGDGYYGKTLVNNGTTLYLNGDNRANSEYGASRRDLTLTDGSVLLMDYSNEGLDGVWTSLWGSKINIDGQAGVTVKDITKLLPDSNGNYSYYQGNVDIADDINFMGSGATEDELTFTVDNTTVTLHSAIQGLGALKKQGSGKLILDGEGDFSSVKVSSGTLQLGSSESSQCDQLAASSITVNDGVLAGWTNALGTLQLNYGVVNILNPNTISLTGSDTALTMNGGTLYVTVQDKDNYTNYKTTDQSAKVAMNGGAIYVSDSSKALNTGDTLTVVQTGNGNLSANKSNYTIYDDIVGKRFVIDSNELENGLFNLVLKESNFSDLATTENEKEIAGSLDDWVDSGVTDPDTKDFLGELENEANSDPHVLNQLTGEMRFSLLNAQVQSRNLIRQTLTQNVLPPSGAGIVPGVSALRGQTTYEESDGLGGWGSAYGAFGDAKEHKGTSGYDFDLLGGIFGVELGRNETNQFGFYFSYSNLRVDAQNAMGNGRLNDNQFGLYLRLSDEWGYSFATGSIGVSNYELNRAIALSNYPSLRYTGKTDGWSGSAYIERGMTLSLPGSDLQPYGGLQYVHLKADGFTEGGSLSTLSLRTGDSKYDSLEGVLGIRWLKSTILAQRQFDLNAYANWTHEFLDANAEGKVALVGQDSGSIRIVGNGVGRDWIYAGLGGTLHMTDAFTIFGGADVQVNDYTSYVNGHAGMKYVW